jgi:hypothetical protein
VVEPGDGFRAYEPAGEHAATFCRLEHVVPWTIRGAPWDARALEVTSSKAMSESCAQCGGPLGDAPIVLVSHRGEHRVADAVCSVEHLRAWAAAGGRWRP